MSAVLEDSEEQVSTTQAKMFKSKKERESIFAQLKVMGIAYITVSFSGSGDSGDIDDISACGHRKEQIQGASPGAQQPVPIDITDKMLSLPAKSLVFSEADGWTVADGVGQVSVEKAMERLFWMVDEDHNPTDWVNNDGGQGTMEVDVDAGTITINYSYNETVSTDAGSVEVV